MDNILKIKIEHARIEKQITDAKPLLDLCKIKEPDFIEITATAQILHSFYNGVESVIILFFKNSGEKLPRVLFCYRSGCMRRFCSQNKQTAKQFAGLAK